MCPFNFSSFKEQAKQQKLHDLRLMPLYLPETLSLTLIKLEDREGNKLALYQSDYKKLREYLKTLSATFSMEDFHALPLESKLEILENAQVKVIKYFSPSNLTQCELNVVNSDFSTSGQIVTSNGLALTKHGHQNCVVMQNDQIYIHPKVRSTLGGLASSVMPEDDIAFPPGNTQGLIGVSHSSLASGRVQFAGSIMHTEKHGWVIDNRTGHYATRAYQLRIFLDKLDELGVPLEQMTVLTCVSKTGRVSPTDTDDSYDLNYENARTFLDRVHSSLNASTASLTERSRSSSDSNQTTTGSLDGSDFDIDSISSNSFDDSDSSPVMQNDSDEGETDASDESSTGDDRESPTHP